ncbi:DUF3572 domain-containing protein [Camelimonas abortus]|uniref:DUF3572 domain-containing protein n=1 Tax=Camelimonas abortus TaxID=1017184 RepID=A0ABV7LE50_9HYPH
MLIPRQKDGGRGAAAPDPAELAIRALAWLAGDADRLGDFLVMSGLTVDRLRAAASRPEFLAAVLEHLLQDEALLLAFCASEGADPAQVAPACRRLQGGRPPAEF